MNLRTLSLHRLPVKTLQQSIFGNLREFSSTPTNLKSLPSWASIDPEQLGVSKIIHHVDNIVNGKWQRESGTTKHEVISIPNPLHKSAPPIFTISDLTVADLYPFSTSLKAVSKSGLHNPLKNVHRYLMYGEISRKAGNFLSQPDIAEFFATSIMKCVPKSHAQALGEVSNRVPYAHL